MDYEVGESLLSGLVGLLRPAKEDIIQKPDLLDGKHHSWTFKTRLQDSRQETFFFFKILISEFSTKEHFCGTFLL